MVDKTRYKIIGFSCVSVAVVSVVGLIIAAGGNTQQSVVDSGSFSAPHQALAMPESKKSIPKIIASNHLSSPDVPMQMEPVAATPKEVPRVFAASLEGTDIDGQLKADASGNLIVDIEIKDFFDYFLNTVGEVSPEVAVSEIQMLAASHLPPEAADQAMKILGDYLAYKEQAMSLMAQPMLPKEQQTASYQVDMLEKTFQTLKTLRRQTMSPEAVEAFFAMEEAYGEYTLASIRVQSDESLSVSEKASLVSYHREKLPPVIRQTEEHVIADAEKHQEVHQAIASGNEAELTQQLAEKGYSTEATEEIVAFQSQQKAFDQRYQQYHSERQSLISSGLSEQDQEQQIDVLRARYFSDEREITQAKVRDLNS